MDEKCTIRERENYSIQNLVQKPEGNNPLATPRFKIEDNIKIDSNIMEGYICDSCDSQQRQIVGSNEHHNDFPVFTE